MVEIWYVILALMLTAFAVTEGWDFGVGMLHRVVARTAAERAQVVASIGPLWSWNEVWLIAAGGVLFLAFPKVLATALAGYYLAVFLLLWTLVVRGMALEVGGHIDDAMWLSFWDTALAASSLLLAVLFGAAFGNLVRGVPLDGDGVMFMPLFTDFRARGRTGILDWYTLSVAAFTVLLLAAHGAGYLAYRTDGPVQDRAARLARRLWPVVVALLPVVSWLTHVVRPEFFPAMLGRPVAWLAVLALLAGLVGVFAGQRSGKDALAFGGACLCLAGLLGGAAASMFPVMLRSTLDASWSLTAHAGASGPRGLTSALVWWPAAAAMSIGYAGWIGRRYAGRVRLLPTVEDAD